MIGLKRKLFHDVRTYQLIRLVATGLFVYCMVLVINDTGKQGNGVLIIDEQEDIPLPGQFNLLEDAAQFNGAMRRPQKKCTLGKYVNVGFHRDHFHLRQLNC